MDAGKLLSVVALAAVIVTPALAQQAKAPAQIAVTAENLVEPYTALGALTATVHPKSMAPKTPTRDLLDAELRKQAAKLGADAVIQVRYTLRNPMMTDKGSDAMGVAVRFTGAAAPPAPAPASQAVASAPAPSAPAPSPAPSAPARLAATPVAPPQQVAAAPPPVAAAAVAPAVAAARHASSVDMIVVTDQDMAGRRYTRLGDVRAEVHQKSMFPKTPSKDLLVADLKAQALKLGADAVIETRYSMHNALTSTKGDVAAGVAVRFD